VASSDAVAGGIPRSGGGRIRGAAGRPPLAHGSTTPPGGVISAPGWAGDLLQWPWLPLVPLLAIPILGASTENIRHVILAMELIFLAKAVENPVWVLGALVLSELTMRNYYLLLVASFIILLPHFLDGRQLAPNARRMAILAFSFVALVSLSDVMASDLSHAYPFAKSMVVGVVALFIVPLAIKTKDDLRQVGIAALVTVAASAALAIVQQLAGALVIDLTPVTAGADAATWAGRSTGLAGNPIRLSNDLMLFLFPIIGLLVTKAVPQRARPFLILLSLLLLVALTFSQTRTWIPAAVTAGAVMALVMGLRLRKELLLLLPAMALLFIAGSTFLENRYSRNLADDSSVADRPVLWLAAFNIATDHPVLGVGHDGFLQLAPRYAQEIDPGLLAHENAGEALGQLEPHNDYLNVWSSFGTGALLVYLALLFFTGRNFVQAHHQSGDPFVRGIAVGGLGALVAFAVNSFFHNFFTGTLTVWILAGLSLAILQLSNAYPQPPPGKAKP